MKILLFGQYGQLGAQLKGSLSNLGEVISLDRSSQNLCGDLENLDGLASTVSIVKPDVIVNAAAYTAVDLAEKESDIAFRVNTIAPELLAKAAKQCGAWLVHFSTDYVFGGNGSRPWAETDNCKPLSVYGQTKRDGEIRIQLINPKYLIIRTSWIFSAQGSNFLKTILRLAQERSELRVVDDQIGSPTSAKWLSKVTADMILALSFKEPVPGLYHVVPTGTVSWYGYAKYVFDQARLLDPQMDLALQELIPIGTSEYSTLAKRPLNSRLDTQKFQKEWSILIPHWTEGVKSSLSEILMA